MRGTRVCYVVEEPCSSKNCVSSSSAMSDSASGAPTSTIKIQTVRGKNLGW